MIDWLPCIIRDCYRVLGLSKLGIWYRPRAGVSRAWDTRLIPFFTHSITVKSRRSRGKPAKQKSNTVEQQ